MILKAIGFNRWLFCFLQCTGGKFSPEDYDSSFINFLKNKADREAGDDIPEKILFDGELSHCFEAAMHEKL